MDTEHYLLNRLDHPVRFLGINKDEAFAFIGPLMMGFCTGYPTTGFISGVALLSLYRAFKKKNEGSSLIHAIYWHFPTSRKAMKLYVPSHVREYIG
jgi:type IV conjugative transfer system protein TraL